MAASVMASVSLKPAAFNIEKSTVKGLPCLARSSASFRVEASGGKKIKTDTPYGTCVFISASSFLGFIFLLFFF